MSREQNVLMSNTQIDPDTFGALRLAAHGPITDDPCQPAAQARAGPQLRLTQAFTAKFAFSQTC